MTVPTSTITVALELSELNSNATVTANELVEQTVVSTAILKGEKGDTGATGATGATGSQGDPATNLVTSVATRIGNVVLTKSDVGLSNVDNTSDVNKPVSTAQAAADALKIAIANNLSDLNSASVARTNLGLGTLATQSGTFSGTSSGTNTGDQTISDATITTSDITTNNVSTSKHGFAPKSPNDATKYLDGTGAYSVPSGGAVSSVAGRTGAVVLGESDITNLTTDLAAKQPLDSDLTTIAGLTATTDSFLQSKASAWTARTVAQVKTDLGLTGTNSGDQTITLTGDVTGSGTGSFAATVAANAVTNAKTAQMAAHTFKGNNTGSTANALDLTATQLTAELNAFVGDSGAGGTKGSVPAPITGDATKFLKGDGTWGTVSSSGDMVLASAQTVTGTKTFNTGTLLDKGSHIFNVVAYGATGNGTTDDTTAIAAAITAAASSNGATVFFPRGTYLISSPLAITTGIKFSGTSKRGSIITSTAATSIFTFAANAFWWEVSDLTITNSGGHIFVGSHNLSAFRVYNCSLQASGNTTSIWTQSGGQIIEGYFAYCDLYMGGAAPSVAAFNWTDTASGFNANVFEKCVCTTAAASTAYFFSLVSQGAGNNSYDNCFRDIVFEQTVGGAIFAQSQFNLILDNIQIWDVATIGASTASYISIGKYSTANSSRNITIKSYSRMSSALGVGLYDITADVTTQQIVIDSFRAGPDNGKINLNSATPATILNQSPGTTIVNGTFSPSSFAGTGNPNSVAIWTARVGDIYLDQAATSGNIFWRCSVAGTPGTWVATDLPTPVYDPAGIAQQVVGTTATQTVTGKRITARTGSTASSATPSINTDSYDEFDITALAANITSMTTNLTGTPVNGDELILRFKDNGTARTIAWGTSFVSSGVATLLATTAISKTHFVKLRYDSTIAKWVCMAVDAAGY